MKKVLSYILQLLARLTLWRYRPAVVGVTGSVGKTSTKEAVTAVMAQRFNVYSSSKNFNNEIGVPLTIICASDSGYNNPFKWLVIFMKALGQIVVFNKNYPQYLVLEMGVDHKGDMDYLLSLAQPKIGVLTAVSEVHLEYFGSVEAVLAEKSKLLKRLPKDGVAVINYDDNLAMSLVDKIKSRILTYGFNPQAEVWADGIQLSKDDSGEVRGLSFKLHYGGSTTPLLLPNILGQHQIYVALAAAAVGLALGLTTVDVSAALKNFVFPSGRMKLLRGVKDSYIIDDSYNSSPLALSAALKTLADFPGYSGAKKWAILGDMLELGSVSEEMHRKNGREAVNLGIDYLVTVGERARDFGRGAQAAGFDSDHYVNFTSHLEAVEFVKQKIATKDVMLIKGSQGARMERVTKGLMAEPEKAREFLVRQYKPWI